MARSYGNFGMVFMPRRDYGAQPRVENPSALACWIYVSMPDTPDSEDEDEFEDDYG
jgi:hypothetical protein